VIDPGLEPGRILTAMSDAGLEPAAILCTHGHADHIAGNAGMKQAFPGAPLIIGEGDAAKLLDPELNLSAIFSAPLVSPPADRLVREGDIVEAAGMSFVVRDTPGHSSGHVVFIAKDQVPPVVFGGDVLFQGSVGRTDFPDGSFEQLAASIRDKLFTLPDQTEVYPGHGEPTTIGEEKETNSYVGSRRF
jgi:glyoxylase-like metal-dependent hydrolase (beta-lactamase superfamily II)